MSLPIYSNMDALCKENGITIAQLERNLQYPKAYFSKWKTSMPSVANAKIVADYFGVTIDYLIDENHSASESKCLSLFRRLTEEDKEIAFRILSALGVNKK